MRTVGHIAFSAFSSQRAESEALVTTIEKQIGSWLESKNAPQFGPGNFHTRDGREATLHWDEIDAPKGRLGRWVLSEPTNGGRFETSLTVASDNQSVVVDCVLVAGNPTSVIAPITFDPYCPVVISKILDSNIEWHVGNTVVRSQPLTIEGASGGEDLVDTLLDESRTLPIVVISQQFGFLLHPDIDTRMASELAGLAIVANVDDAATWLLTQRLGKEWSCYNGAIRMYWPNLRIDTSPYAHPLWTDQRLLLGTSNSWAASLRIRNQIRHTLFDLSSTTVVEPPLIRIVRESERSARNQRRQLEAKESGTYQELAEAYAKENDDLRQQLDETLVQLDGLRNQYQAIALQRAWDSPTLVTPESTTPPQSVQEAVERAKLEFAQYLVIGSDVAASVNSLAVNAGPPDTVLSHLEALSDLCKARREGPLGDSVVGWLKNKNISSSGESETTSNNRRLMNQRRWDDGSGNKRQFDSHLKVSDGTSPDRCVRIYYLWDDVTHMILVGYVGRHLDV